MAWTLCCGCRQTSTIRFSRSVLPESGNADVHNKVAIRHLVMHTSGLGSFFNDEFESEKLRAREVRDYVGRTATRASSLLGATVEAAGAAAIPPKCQMNGLDVRAP